MIFSPLDKVCVLLLGSLPECVADLYENDGSALSHFRGEGPMGNPYFKSSYSQSNYSLVCGLIQQESHISGRLIQEP
jgi:hypothetical protein